MDIKAFRGLSGTYNVRASELDRGAPRNIECLVEFLNNTQHKFVLDRRSKGQCLLDCVFKHLNLIETDFFGLKYLPQESHNQQQQQQDDIIIANAKTSNNNSNPLLTKTQSLNSYDHSPSSNASLSSSSVTPNATNSINHNNNNNNNNNLSIGSSITTTTISQTITTLTTTTTQPTNLNIINGITNTINNSTCNDTTKCNNNNIYSQQSLNNSNNNNDNNNIATFIEERWLDPTKSIRKQYKSGPPFKFYFRVKFYVSDPCKLADDTTRHHLYLQLRQDILNNRLIVPTCSAILLASYILQSEVGDYRRGLQEEDYASNFRLLPNQNDDIKKKVIELHKQHKSLSSADAEYQFLEHAAKKLDCYGVEFYDAKDTSKNNVQIGVSSNGVVVFRDNKRMNQFSWAKIIKIMFKKRIFSIQLRQDEGKICDNFIEFNLLTNQACKSFWEECVAQHSFFGLHQPKNSPKKFFSFLNFGSKFQYNGKTEYQTMEESRKRSFSHFSRSPSKRYARRTIPVGKPSWSETAAGQESKKPHKDDDCNHNIDNIDHSNANTTSEGISATKNNIKDSGWIFSNPIASGSTSSNKSVDESLIENCDDPTLPNYKPSILYIDDSKNTLSPDSAQHSSLEGVSKAHEVINNDDNGNNDVNKKDLKRGESLRLSNPIKGAISLTKKAGATSSNQLVKISESLRDKFRAGKSKSRKSTQSTKEIILETQNDCDLDTNSETSSKIVKLSPGRDGKYGFKIRQVPLHNSNFKALKSRKSKERCIIIYDVSPNSPAATCDPRLYEGDQLITINGIAIDGLSESKVESLIKNIQHQKPPNLALEILSRYNNDCGSIDSLGSQSETNSRLSPISVSSASKRSNQTQTLANSIKAIKKGLEKKDGKMELIEEFEKLSRKKEDESLDESKLMENIDKNRYRDILPYDSTRVQLNDSMTGDYINASFVNMVVPSGNLNKYIATQGPLSSTCDDFWQMIWEQNCTLIIMVTPLIEAGRVKCHKYWPDEKEETRYGQIIVRNNCERSRTATIDRSIQLLDVKSGEKRTVSQIQYKAWPDHEIPEDCSDFLKLVTRVRKHRASKPNHPIVVHCSAGIGRTGVLILMETAICIMESGEPIYPIKILEEMRRQRAMLIQTNSQFMFVADAICKVYDQKLYKKSRKHKKK